LTHARTKPLVVAATGVVLVAGLVVAAFLARPKAHATPAAPVAVGSPSQPGFPVPPPGAVVFAREWGASALALGVVPGHGSTLVQASVLGPQGRGVSGLAISLNGRRARACGGGCYSATLDGVPRSVELRVRSTRWTVLLPTPWPPRDGAALVRRASATWRSLRSLTVDERLASDAEHAAVSVWRMQAPDRLAYQVRNGWGGVIVGGKRWDRAPNAKRWVESPQTPVTQPTPVWYGISDAHVLGTGTVAGRPAWRISFFDPRTPAWFEIAVDRSTYRTLETQMITTAHFMHDVYRRFDSTPAVVPPR
jgi:hypothetical protein